MPTEMPERPCLDYYINRCIAPCTSYCTKEEYDEVIRQVLLFLEDTFDVRVSDNEVTEHNLGSLRSIGRFILSKRVGSAAA